MRTVQMATVFFLLFLLPCPAGGRNHTETWTAWVSDQGCGAQHTKPGGADCIRKCKRGGASVGHPEWKPQPVVLVKESDKSVWVVKNPGLLDGREGERWTLTVSVNPTEKSVRVKSIAKPVEGSTP